MNFVLCSDLYFVFSVHGCLMKVKFHFFKVLYLVWPNTPVLSLFQAFMILKLKSESQTDTIVEPYVIHGKVSDANLSIFKRQ